MQASPSVPESSLAGRYSMTHARPEDASAVEAFWRSFPEEYALGCRPTVRLVARDGASGAIVGVAEYGRTFPPEDALACVAVAPEVRSRRLGASLLRSLAEAARANGIRNLGMFLRKDDLIAWRLMVSCGVPLRLYEAGKRLYVELDLVRFAKEPKPVEAGEPQHNPVHFRAVLSRQ